MHIFPERFDNMFLKTNIKLTLLIEETPPSIMYLHVEQISDNYQCAFKVQHFLSLFRFDLVDIVSSILFKKKLKQYLCSFY
jgi:hypothetical protein